MVENANKNEDDNDSKVEESISAESAAAQADVMLAGEKQNNQKELHKNRNRILIAILLAMFIALGVFLLVGGDSDDDNASTTQEMSETQQDEDTDETPAATATEFDQIVYAHSSAENLPRDLFTRPVTGGDRVSQDFNFGRNQFLNFARDGQSYAVLSDDGDLYFGTGSNEPTMVASGVEAESSLLLDASANSILVIFTDVADLVNPSITITEYATTGEMTEFFSEPAADLGSVIFGEHWNGDSKTLTMRRSCTQCDGYNAVLSTLDANGNETEVFTPDSIHIGSGYALNSDGSRALFVTSTDYPEGNSFGINGGLGGPEGAPFTLFEVELAGGTATELITFGEPEDVGDDGFFSAPSLFWADSDDGTQRATYSYLKKLFVRNGNGSFDNYFETGQGDIQSIYAVDQDEVLVGGKNSDGETISYFNIDTQEGAIVMETLFTTTILAVTLK